MTSSCTSQLSSNFVPAGRFCRWRNKWKSLGARSGLYGGCEFPLDVQFLRWEIVWWNAPRIWRDFGSALPFNTRLTQTNPILPLSNEHGLQVKDQGRRQCCLNKYKNFPIGLHVMYLYFPDTPRMYQPRKRLVARPWTQWLKRLPVRVRVRTYIYVRFIIHISLKSAFLRTTNSTILFCNALYNTAQNILPVSNHGDSKEATRGCCTVSHVF
jgi:hypothetical protein